jgi:glutamine amidotransferase
MTIAVVDSGGANISSVLHALRRLGAEPVFTGEPEAIRTADRIILPGVGSAGAAMGHLRNSGLDILIPELARPVLGICLGMQLLFSHSSENDTPLLGIIEAEIARLPEAPGLRIPHMGWNRIEVGRQDPLLNRLNDAWFYFVHSYAAPTGDWTLASSLHGESFSAVVRQGNFWGAQFHPERSAANGAMLLTNFLEA